MHTPRSHEPPDSSRLNPAPSPIRSWSPGVWVILVVWGVFVTLPPVGLSLVRERLLAWQSSPAAQQQWTEFREAMQEESTGAGPVKRKVPKSVEPPLKVWLRDYFGLAIGAWVLFGSVLFFVVVILGRGAVRSRT